MLARVSVISVRNTSYYFVLYVKSDASCLIWTIVDTEYMCFPISDVAQRNLHIRSDSFRYDGSEVDISSKLGHKMAKKL